MTVTFTDKQQYREQKFDQYFFKIVNDIFASILLALPFIPLLCNENECFPVKVCGLAITHSQQDESYDILQYKHFEWQRYKPTRIIAGWWYSFQNTDCEPVG